jgi:hypothetical protein
MADDACDDVLIACLEWSKGGAGSADEQAVFGRIFHFLVRRIGRGESGPSCDSAFLMMDSGGRRRRAEGAVLVQAEGGTCSMFSTTIAHQKIRFSLFRITYPHITSSIVCVKGTGASEKKKKQRVKETTDQDAAFRTV